MTKHAAAGTDLIAPLVLLQLSDLHFGPHSRFAGGDLERLAAQCRQALDEARADLGWGEAIGLVIVTGDIAEAARPPEYAAAAMFFRALTRQLALSPHRFVFVPGNHDISWTKCSMVEGQLKDGEFPDSELRTRLDEVKFAHFEKFISDLHGGKARHEVDGAAVTSLLNGVFVHDFPDLGVSVAALNSCERESHRKEDLRTAGPHPTMGHRPVEITLDDMYTSLRFDAELDPATLDRGAPITADDLVRPRRPQVVIGAAGSGKTTWMRWTFRRLIRDPRAVGRGVGVPDADRGVHGVFSRADHPCMGCCGGSPPGWQGQQS